MPGGAAMALKKEIVMFWNLFRAEHLKLKRSPTFWVFFFAPILMDVCGILILFKHQPYAGHEITQQTWVLLFRDLLFVWAVFALPLLTTLASASLAGMEYDDNQWKYLLSLPVRRGAVYLVKWLAAFWVILISTLVLFLGWALSGFFIPWTQPLIFAFCLDMLQQSLLVILLALCMVSIHTWLSLRWRNLFVGLGAGILGVLGNLILVNFKNLHYFFPWLYPSLSLNNLEPLPILIVLGVGGGLLLALAGSMAFSRREVL